MDQIIKYFSANYEWLFSGILSGLIFFLLGNKHGYDKAIKQKQKVGKNGKGIQVSGNYTVTGKSNE